METSTICSTVRFCRERGRKQNFLHDLWQMDIYNLLRNSFLDALLRHKLNHQRGRRSVPPYGSERPVILSEQLPRKRTRAERRASSDALLESGGAHRAHWERKSTPSLSSTCRPRSGGTTREERAPGRKGRDKLESVHVCGGRHVHVVNTHSHARRYCAALLLFSAVCVFVVFVFVFFVFFSFFVCVFLVFFCFCVFVCVFLCFLLDDTTTVCMACALFGTRLEPTVNITSHVRLLVHISEKTKNKTKTHEGVYDQHPPPLGHAISTEMRGRLLSRCLYQRAKTRHAARCTPLFADRKIIPPGCLVDSNVSVDTLIGNEALKTSTYH